MAESAGEKSFDATPHRRQEAREQGQVVFSQDLASAAMLMLGVLLLMMFGRAVVDRAVAGDEALAVTRARLGGDGVGVAAAGRQAEGQGDSHPECNRPHAPAFLAARASSAPAGSLAVIDVMILR